MNILRKYIQNGLIADITIRWSLNGEYLAVVGTRPPQFRSKDNGRNHSSLQLLIYDWRGTLRQKSDVPFDTTVSSWTECSTTQGFFTPS